MIEVDRAAYPDILSQYKKTGNQFPLILSVLENTQAGKIYSDEAQDNYFIVHKFGFSQLLEKKDNASFDKTLISFLNDETAPQKIRWYDVSEKWNTLEKHCSSKSVALVERTQLSYKANPPLSPSNIELLNETNFDNVEHVFDLMLGDRFWSSKQDFLQHSLGVIAYKNDQPAALCYACTIANNVAEIDIYTKEEYRKQGLAELAAHGFLAICAQRGITAHWDCYSNNLASLKLAEKLGFSPYHVYTHAIVGPK